MRLFEAREKAERIRFRLDRATNLQADDTAVTEEASVKSSLRDLEIVPDLTPSLARVLAESHNRLEIPGHAVQAFVFSSSEVQASCTSKSLDKCVLKFSSALINLLSEEELSFVIGHELGHFLLQHGKTRPESQLVGEDLRMCRYQEISADRIGLLACKSFNIVVRTLMKLVSGLSSEYLTFDTEAFLRQMRDFHPDMPSTDSTTHPPTLIRTQALLWFSKCLSDSQPNTLPDSATMYELDVKVQKLLEPYISAWEDTERKNEQEAKRSLLLWLAAENVCEDGKLTSTEFGKLKTLLGGDKAKELQAYLRSLNARDVLSIIAEKKGKSIKRYEQVTGGKSSRQTLKDLRERVTQALQ